MQLGSEVICKLLCATAKNTIKNYFWSFFFIWIQKKKEIDKTIIVPFEQAVK